MAAKCCQTAPSNFPSFTSSCRCSACSCRSELSLDSTSASKTTIQSIISCNCNTFEASKTAPGPTNFHHFHHVFQVCSHMFTVFRWPWRGDTPVHLDMISSPLIDDLPVKSRDFPWQTVKRSRGPFSKSWKKKHLRYSPVVWNRNFIESSWNVPRPERFWEFLRTCHAGRHSQNSNSQDLVTTFGCCRCL